MYFNSIHFPEGGITYCLNSMKEDISQLLTVKQASTTINFSTIAIHKENVFSKNSHINPKLNNHFHKT